MAHDLEERAGTPEGVAIIGMAGRFPGARTTAELWANLRAGVESIRHFTEMELIEAGETPERLADPNYVRSAGCLDDIAGFDARFFGMSPRDAAVFDPQHRLFLECAWEALEDAGYVGDRIGGAVGVFAAAGGPEYLMHNLLANRQIMDTVGPWLVRHTGNDQNFLATRVSYELNLRGPSLNVQTACSSALSAVHLASQSLLAGECDAALAGGTTVYPQQIRGYLYRQGEILSPDGHCRVFDARAAGTVMSSGLGCVVLKRLDDALRDGDRILAVIRGSAMNNDGSDKVGYLAPSVSGQVRVVREALAVADVNADEVSYVEAHGTGTLIGDPVELAALTEAFRAQTTRNQYCALGSIKSNIGHAGEAAGICGLIKTVLALQQREIPASLHFETPNPEFDLGSSPFYVNSLLRPWTVEPGATRIAGVTALGAGGTNVHVVLEEAPEPVRTSPGRAVQLLALSAQTQTALDRATERLAAHLEADPALPLADVAYTLLTGRAEFAYRQVVVARDIADAVVALTTPERRRQITQHHRLASAPRVCFMFPGGGAQYPQMGAELYATESCYREAFDLALSHLEPELRTEIHGLVTAGVDRANPDMLATARRRLEAPSRALPALFATEYAIAQQLRAWGIAPDALIGHSAGEYVAATLAGVISLRDGMTLISLRGRLFETLGEGGMLSVPLSSEQARTFMSEELSIAAVNAPALCVLSGPLAAIARAEEALRKSGIECTRVHINVAAHSAMVEPILGEFGRFCRTISFNAPRIPLISNVTGTWMTHEVTSPEYWEQHLRRTVRFADGMEMLLGASAAACIEIGPGRTLTSLARQQPTKPVSAISTMRHPDEVASDVAVLLGAVGRLWTTGIALDTKRLFDGQLRKRVGLPTYPFERDRHWVDPDPPQATTSDQGPLRKQPDLTRWFSVPTWVRAASPGSFAAPSTWMVLRDSGAVADEIVQRLRRGGHRVVEVFPAARFAVDALERYRLDPAERTHFVELADCLVAQNLRPRRVLHLWALDTNVGRFRPFAAAAAQLSSYHQVIGRNFLALLNLMHAFGAEPEPLALYAVASGLQQVTSGDDVRPERAVLQGPLKVIPREYPHVACVSIDIESRGWRRAGGILDRLMLELSAEVVEPEIALRGHDRWVRRFEPAPLPKVEARPWLRPDGVFLITGGLGGIGLAIAEHLAACGPVRIALVGRTALGSSSSEPLDPRSATVERIRSRGAQVITYAADVADPAAMRRVVGAIRERFGRIDGVIHAAGVLRDEIIALRDSRSESVVLDSKMKGAWVLDQLFGNDGPDLFVLFSSVSSVLGLPGQADYTAANAYLDALATARRGRARGRSLSINWSAWREVGMLAPKVAALPTNTPEWVGSAKAPSVVSVHPILETVLIDSEELTLASGRLSRADCWVVGEHVVNGGDAVVPGTGFLEFVRAVFARGVRARPVELVEVIFLAPCVVPATGTRNLRVRIDRSGARGFTCFDESPDKPLVIGHVRDAEPGPDLRVDLDAIRARCGRPGPCRDGRLVQTFMTFGPRWRNVTSIALGDREALLSLELPHEFAGDLELFALHPALLDMATGGAQAIAPGFDSNSTFNVPFSYERVVVRHPLELQVVSHVRLRDDAARNEIAFDVSVYDSHGRELVTIHRFAMRSAGGVLAGATAQRSARLGDAAAAAGAAAMREGMTTTEGIDAFDRMLAVDFSPQIIACTVPLRPWLERLGREATAGRGNGLDSEGGAMLARPRVSANHAPPRDDVEREIARQWSALLGVDEVGIHDDFFELGGQSLIAARLFQGLSKAYGIDLPLSSLFQAPTIAGSAALLRARLGLPEPGPDDATPPAASISPAPQTFRHVVSIQRGAGGPPLFVVHGAGGNVLNFRDIARSMQPARPVYGLQAAGVDGITSVHGSIEEMAVAYLAEIRAIAPMGPYLISGYSGGGIVAFEIARRLEESGERVGLLAFIDTFHPQMPVARISMGSRLQRLRSEGLAYVREVIERRQKRAADAAADRAIATHLAAGEPIPFALREPYVRRAFEEAARRYRPRPWVGTATLFKAAEVAYYFRPGGPCYGWERDLLGGVDLVPMEGNHDTIVLGANGRRVGEELSRRIALATTSDVPRERIALMSE